MHTITVQEAQSKFPELLGNLETTGDVIIHDSGRPIAKLTPIRGTSLRDLAPTSIGGLLRPYPNEQDDLLGEMLAEK